jgi:negative regulator of replication initiation
MESIACQVDEDTKQYLEAEAGRLDTSVSDIARTLLTDAKNRGVKTDSESDDTPDLTATQLYQKIETVRQRQTTESQDNKRIYELETKVNNLIEMQKAILMHAEGVSPVLTYQYDKKSEKNNQRQV